MFKSVFISIASFQILTFPIYVFLCLYLFLFDCFCIWLLLIITFEIFTAFQYIRIYFIEIRLHIFQDLINLKFILKFNFLHFVSIIFNISQRINIRTFLITIFFVKFLRRLSNIMTDMGLDLNLMSFLHTWKARFTFINNFIESLSSSTWHNQFLILIYIEHSCFFTFDCNRLRRGNDRVHCKIGSAWKLRIPFVASLV